MTLSTIKDETNKSTLKETKCKKIKMKTGTVLDIFTLRGGIYLKGYVIFCSGIV
jgi:hypothetical protein